jgi:hypothetical protein
MYRTDDESKQAGGKPDRLGEALNEEACQLDWHMRHLAHLADEPALHPYHAAELLLRVSRINGALAAALLKAEQAVEEAKGEAQWQKEAARGR